MALAGIYHLGMLARQGGERRQAALRRLVADELTQHIDNQEDCTVLFDVESFSDSMSLSLVARAGFKLAYPPVLLGLALLTCAGHVERLALYGILQKSHELRPSTTIAIWHSERNLRRARWSTRRLRRRCSWCGTYKRTSWRLLPSQWSLQPHEYRQTGCLFSCKT